MSAYRTNAKQPEEGEKLNLWQKIKRFFTHFECFDCKRHMSNKYKDGFFHVCKDCYKEKLKSFAEENRKERYAKIKEEVEMRVQAKQELAQEKREEGLSEKEIDRLLRQALPDAEELDSDLKKVFNR